MVSTAPDSFTASAPKEAVIAIRETPVVAVLGTGMYGRALACRLAMNRQVEVRVGSRTPTEGQVTQVEAVRGARVVLLAVPPQAHAAVIHSIAPHLAPNTVVVDISNHPLCAPPPENATTSIAHQLQAIVPNGVVVAKAFNTLSAYALTTSKRAPIVHIACDSADGVDVLSAVCVRAGLVAVHHGSLSAAVELEANPHQLFPAWRPPFYLSIIVFVWWVVYDTLARCVIGGHGPRGGPSLRWHLIYLQVLMSATGEASMTLFALTFVAGPVAGMIQLVRGSASKPFGRFFGGWLDMRKQLGVVAFAFASMHAVVGVTSKALLKTNSEPDWMEIVCFTFGLLSYSAFTVLAICTSQNVADSMSWAEFRAVFSWLGMGGLLFGVLHQAFSAWISHGYSPSPSKFWIGHGGVMPSSSWVGIVIPLVAIAVRLIVWSPCAVIPLRTLRNEVRVDLKNEHSDTESPHTHSPTLRV